MSAGDTPTSRAILVAGNNLIDIGQPVIDSVAQRPRSDDTFHPVVTGEINYTFGNGWQAFFGTSIEDAVTLDGVTQLGARKDLGSAGILQGGLLFSGIPTQVWEDPYAEGVRREETDRDSTGLRLQWDRVLGTALELTFSYRDISIDTERSGEGVTSVACNAACQDLLRRDGDQYHFDASYLFRLGEGQRHLVRPMIRYTIDDREGDAISGDALPSAVELHLPWPGLHGGEQRRVRRQQPGRAQPDLRPQDQFRPCRRRYDAVLPAADRQRALAGGGQRAVGRGQLRRGVPRLGDPSVNLGVMYRFGAR